MVVSLSPESATWISPGFLFPGCPVFNPSKCNNRVRSSPEIVFFPDVSGTPIPASSLIKDLGVQTDNMFSPSAQGTEAANKARRLIFMIKRSFQDLSKSAFIPLYGALVRPHFKYGMSACSSNLILYFWDKDCYLMKKKDNKKLRGFNLVSCVWNKTLGPWIKFLSWALYKTPLVFATYRQYITDIVNSWIDVPWIYWSKFYMRKTGPKEN